MSSVTAVDVQRNLKLAAFRLPPFVTLHCSVWSEPVLEVRGFCRTHPPQNQGTQRACCVKNGPKSTKLHIVQIRQDLLLASVVFIRFFSVFFPLSPPTNVLGVPLSIRLVQEGPKDCQQKIQNLFLVRRRQTGKAQPLDPVSGCGVCPHALLLNHALGTLRVLFEPSCYTF